MTQIGIESGVVRGLEAIRAGECERGRATSHRRERCAAQRDDESRRCAGAEVACECGGVRFATVCPAKYRVAHRHGRQRRRRVCRWRGNRAGRGQCQARLEANSRAGRSRRTYARAVSTRRTRPPPCRCGATSRPIRPRARANSNTANAGPRAWKTALMRKNRGGGIRSAMRSFTRRQATIALSLIYIRN